MRARCSLLGLLGIVGVTACGPELERVSEVRGLRILATQKNVSRDGTAVGGSYAIPGEQVEFSMLWFNGSQTPRPVERLWLGGCLNPAADDYRNCGAQLLDRVGRLDELGRLQFLAENLKIIRPQEDAEPASLSSTVKDTVTFKMPSADLALADRDYGVYYVFSAVCAGTVRLSSDGAVPIECVDSSDETPLGASDFVLSTTAVYLFPGDLGLQNQNPVIRSLWVGEALLSARMFDDGNDVGACVGTHCFLSGESTGNLPPIASVAACPDDGDIESCPGIRVYPVLVADENNESDPLASSKAGDDVKERVWVNYHVDRGKVRSDVRLMRDGSTTWFEDYGTDFFAPSTPGPAHVWAVVRDSRGGVNWIYAPIMVHE